jgi:hypothetical protein
LHNDSNCQEEQKLESGGDLKQKKQKELGKGTERRRPGDGQELAATVKSMAKKPM